MSRLRLRNQARNQVIESPSEVVCSSSFRSGPVGSLIEAGRRFSREHPTVKAHPEFFEFRIPLQEVLEKERQSNG
jgi:hypothetical protein